jgi:Sec7-like guanine-nucleotide exchange factor
MSDESLSKIEKRKKLKQEVEKSIKIFNEKPKKGLLC